jgi:hypothetical protein
MGSLREEWERLELGVATRTHKATDKDSSECEIVASARELRGTNEVVVAEVHGIDQTSGCMSVHGEGARLTCGQDRSS